MAGLAHDGVGVGAVAEGLSDEPGAERVSAEPLNEGGVVTCALGAATDGLVDRGAGDRCSAEVAVLGDGAEQRYACGNPRRSLAALMLIKRLVAAQQSDCLLYTSPSPRDRG